MEDTTPLTITQFAGLKGVPIEAIINAINVKRIVPVETNLVDVTSATIDPSYLKNFKIELIGVYEYAARKGVTYKAVYHRIDKGLIGYYLDPESNKMMIDWVQYAGVRFRKFSMKHRGKNKSVANSEIGKDGGR